MLLQSSTALIFEHSTDMKTGYGRMDNLTSTEPGELDCFMAEVLVTRGSQTRVPNSCGCCGATAYKSLMARDDSGVMRASGHYQCVQCKRVFSSLGEWRERTLANDQLHPPT